MKRTNPGICSLLAWLFTLVAAAAGQAAAEPPDFSGIWTWYVVPGQSPFSRTTPELPFNEAARKKVEEYRALVAPNGDNAGGWCLGTGMPGSMLSSGGYPMEIIQRPEQITVIFEAHQEIRRIFIGEGRYPEADLFPDRNGYSEGRWEGETLVVETTHLKEQVDQTYAHSADAQIVERYRLAKAEDGQPVLEAELSMTDPAFYTATVTALKRWSPVPGGRLLSYECNEPAWEEHLEDLRKAAAGGDAR